MVRQEQNISVIESVKNWDLSNLKVVLWLVRSVPYVLVHPSLWQTAMRFIAWPPWKSWPYLKFRYETMYGNSWGTYNGTWGTGKDIIPFLKWAKSFPMT